MKLHELELGQAIADMHYGTPDFKKLLELDKDPRLSRVTMQVEDGHEIIQALLLKKGVERSLYTNKLLVLVDFGLASPVFAYSYDGRTLGFIEVII